MCITFNDITELKQQAAEIGRARRYAEAIVRTVRTALLVLDKDLRIQSANEHFYRIFKIARADTEGRTIYDIGDGQWDIPGLRALLEEVLPEKKELRDYEVEHEFADLGHRVMRLNAYEMAYAEGPPLILLALEDVSERTRADRSIKKYADDLAQAHQQKDEFLAMLGHELRNPLSAISHGVELLGMKEIGADKVEQIQAMLHRQVRRLTAMVDQLLDVARVMSGKIVMANEPVALAEVAAAAVEAVNPMLEAKGVTLDLSLSPAHGGGEVVVLGDDIRLTQVIENLLGNAVKYNSTGGKVWLRIESTPTEAVMRVRDTGIGIDAALLPHVFEPFAQERRAMARADGGLGLGLTLVRSLVEMHGGRVSVSSAGPDQGCEFVVTLPRLHNAPVRSLPEPPAPAPRERRRVLIIDDEVDAASALDELLQLRGHETLTVHSGEAALASFPTFAPDAVLLDLGLLDVDGYELARRLRSEHQGREVLLVALTGYQRDGERLAAAGFDRHMLKPPDMDQLAVWLDEMYDHGPSPGR